MSAFVATDQLIKQLCLENDDPNFLLYDKFLGGVLDGIADLNMFGMPTFSHATLNLNAYNSVDWPCSMVKPILTCLLRDGRLMIMDVADNVMNTFPETALEEVTTDVSLAGDPFGIDGYWYQWGGWNWGLGELYGLRSGYRTVGWVTHDKTNRQTFVKGHILRSTDQVVIFFKSTGLEECPKFIPAETKTAIEHYVLYKHFRSRNPNLSELNLKNYKENFTRISKFENSESDTEQAWISSMSSNVHSSPKGF